MNIDVGHPVILIDAKGLKKHGLHKGMKGHVNSMATIEDETYVFFMPDGSRKSFVVDLSRLEFDEDRFNGGG